MSIKNKYLAGLMERVIKRNPNEPEFHQAVEEMLETLDPVADIPNTSKKVCLT